MATTGERDTEMADHPTVQGPTPGSLWPAGRFKRLVMEFEVELVDEMALRTFDLHHASDAEGNITGFVDMDINERVGLALSAVFGQAARAAQAQTGIKMIAGTGPIVRWVDETGNYIEMPFLGPLPQRRDDGTYDEGA